MSHFYTLVLVPDSEAVEDQISALLAPYDENLQVTPYEEECWCVGHQALSAAQAAFEEHHPSWEADCDELRAELNHDILQPAVAATGGEVTVPFAPIGEGVARIIAAYQPTPELETLARAEANLAARWHAHFDLRKQAIEEVRMAHPQAGKPDPDCQECGGRGQRSTSYNPAAKWDWWQIGGRWTGVLTDYNPAADPANYEPCRLCDGTGTRTDGISPGKGNCNGCQGTGQRKKWPTEWAHTEGDIQPVANLLAHFTDEVVPYAVVTPDGSWHQRGDMGRWGMSSNDIDADQWTEQVKALLEEHKQAVAVVCDLHI